MTGPRIRRQFWRVFTEAGEAEAAETYQNAVIYLDRTPFYAEGGGQACDNGFMSTKDAMPK